jgi:hypothetical protein
MRIMKSYGISFLKKNLKESLLVGVKKAISLIPISRDILRL